MKVGVVFPQVEIGNDPAAIRDYAQAVEAMGYGWIREAGRDPGQFGIEGRFTLAQVPREQWATELAAWGAMRGVTHVCIHTVGLGLKTPADHVETLRRFRAEAGLAS
jgi:hypothetical protein